MGILFLLTNLVCLAVLVRRRYAKLFPCFVVAQALTTWQAGIRMFGESKAWWAPGEAALLVATTAAVVEAVWASVRVMRSPWRWLIAGGLSMSAFGASVWAASPPDGDLYAQFLQYRVILFLGLALLSFWGFWCGLLVNDHWPRVARMHAGLLATLMIGHASLISWASWGNTNLHYRWLEITCCVGWLINSEFLAQERESLRKGLDVYLRQIADQRRQRAGYPPIRVESHEPLLRVR